MSQVYSTEPATSSKVILETTHGPIEMHLWTNECPSTTKFFLQLCLDGYYDGLKFHRIVPSFLIQTGLRQEWSDWTAYRSFVLNLERRKLETHARIRFNHRGQVAMALPLEENEPALLEPQFFITLEEAPYLDKKHVVFGTVAASPTVFNALRIGNVEVNEQGQPTDWENAPRVLSTKVVLQNDATLKANPDVPWRVKARETKKKKKKRKGKRDINVLSFGDEEEEHNVGVGGGMQSSHDVVPADKKKKKRLVPKKDSVEKKEDEPSQRGEDKPLEKRPKVEEKSQQPIVVPTEAVSVSNGESSAVGPTYIQSPPVQKKTATVDKSTKTSTSLQIKKSSAVEAMRSKYKTKTKTKQEREDDTMAKLLAFQNKVRVKQPKPDRVTEDKDNSLASRMAKRAQASEDSNENKNNSGPTYHGQVLDHSDDDKEGGWLATRFHCRQHMDQKAGDGRDMDDYLVVDGEDRGGRPKHKKRDGKRRHHRHHVSK